jgi:hypothetical protein
MPLRGWRLTGILFAHREIQEYLWGGGSVSCTRMMVLACVLLKDGEFPVVTNSAASRTAD